jgi:hypothetical protein
MAVIMSFENRRGSKMIEPQLRIAFDYFKTEGRRPFSLFPLRVRALFSDDEDGTVYGAAVLPNGHKEFEPGKMYEVGVAFLFALDVVDELGVGRSFLLADKEIYARCTILEIYPELAAATGRWKEEQAASSG